jgi:hypothetical protein
VRYCPFRISGKKIYVGALQGSENADVLPIPSVAMAVIQEPVRGLPLSKVDSLKALAMTGLVQRPRRPSMPSNLRCWLSCRSPSPGP